MQCALITDLSLDGEQESTREPGGDDARKETDERRARQGDEEGEVEDGAGHGR